MHEDAFNARSRSVKFSEYIRRYAIDVSSDALAEVGRQVQLIASELSAEAPSTVYYRRGRFFI